MKLQIIPLLFIVLIFFTQCEKDQSIPKTLPDSETKIVQLKLLNDLKNWHSETVDKYKKTVLPATSRVNKKSSTLEPLWSKARIEKLNNGATATIVPSTEYKLENSKLSMLREFVFLLNPSGTKIKNGKIVEIIGETKYINENKKKLTHLYNSEFIRGFNGTIMTYDVNYRFLWSRTYKDGLIKGTAKLSIQSSIDPKVKSFGEGIASVFSYEKGGAPPVATVSQCFVIVLISTYTDGSTETEVIGSYCSPEEGGGGGGGNPPGNGSGTVTPGDSFGGFPSNPYDGQVYVYNYPSGSVNVFTYNDEFNAWMLPGIQAILDKGYDMQFQATPPNFNGAALSTLVLPALAEPTFIGEVVLAGIITVQITVFAYEYAQYLTHTYNIPNPAQREACIDKFVRCTETTTPDHICAACLGQCRSSGGYWDNQQCPLN